MEDEEDPIVEEIPVFLSKNLQDNLYLFQYPTKTELPNHDAAVVVNCCVKPLTQEVKVDFGLNIESKHYDRFKAEQFAIAADGKNTFGAVPPKGAERPTFKRGIMDKQAFTSTRSLTDISKYVVGIYADKEVHLSPLASIVQLRPSLSHFDKDDKRRKAEQKAQNDEFEEEEVAQQVTVKFARGTGAGAAAKKTKEQRGTYDNFVQRIVDEPWCESFWHARDTPTAELARQKLYSTNHQANQSLSLAASEYLGKLLPHDEHVQQVDTANVMPVYNKAMLKTMPLLDQLRVILKDAKILSFADVLNILSEHIDPHISGDKVLALLPQVGILLHGNWVPKSEVVYPEKMLSHANGVSAEQMIRARDYIVSPLKHFPNLYLSLPLLPAALPLLTHTIPASHPGHVRHAAASCRDAGCAAHCGPCERHETLGAAAAAGQGVRAKASGAGAASGVALACHRAILQ